MTADRKRSFVIHSDGSRALAAKLIADLDMSIHWSFELKPYKRNRSLEQNNLYFAWLKVIADAMGYASTEDIHEEMKAKFLVPILEREDKDFQDDLQLYREMYQRGEKDRALKAKDRLFKRASTTWLSTSQFSEMMNAVEEFAAGYGIVLPQPPQQPETRPKQ